MIRTRVLSSEGKNLLKGLFLNSTKEVDLSTLPMGLYIIEIEIHGVKYHKKILKI
jgi:hypothetical protein